MKLFSMALELKDEFKKSSLKCKPCVVSNEDAAEIDGQMNKNVAAKVAAAIGSNKG